MNLIYNPLRHVFPRSACLIDGLQGNSNNPLSSHDALALGQFWGVRTLARKQRLICVAHDGRSVSSSFEIDVCRGLHSVGILIIRLGSCPTALALSTAKALQTGSSLVVSGGLAPFDQTGFRLFENGQLIDERTLTTFVAFASNGIQKRNHQAGGIVQTDANELYSESLKFVRTKNPDHRLTVWDAQDTCQKSVTSLARTLCGEHLILDGHTPYGATDPLDDSFFERTSAIVKQENALVGFAISIDGGAVRVVNSDGLVVAPYRIAHRLLDNELRTQQQGTLICPLDAPSELLTCARDGGWRVHHSDGSWGDLVQKTQALRATKNEGQSESPQESPQMELSSSECPKPIIAVDGWGHVILPNSFSGVPDGILTALAWLDQSDQQLKDPLAPFSQAQDPERLRLHCQNESLDEALQDLFDCVRNIQPSLRIGNSWRRDTPQGWWSFVPHQLTQSIDFGFTPTLKHLVLQTLDQIGARKADNGFLFLSTSQHQDPSILSSLHVNRQNI